MYRTVLIIGSAALILGFTSTAYAQQGSGARALSGLQSRSIQQQTPRALRSNPNISGDVPPQISPATINIDPVRSEVLLEQRSDRSQLVISPTKEDRELSSPPGAGFSGNNRVHLLYPTD